METKDWIIALRSGDSSPLRLVFEQYGTECVNRLQRQVGCRREDAEDIFVDALLILRRHVLSGKIETLDDPYHYLYKVCYDQYRARQQQSARRESHLPEISHRLYYPYYEAPESEIQIQQKDIQYMTTLVLVALQKLGSKCQQVLKSFYVDGLCMEEIAQKMGWTNANVAKTSKSRCYQKWMQNVRDMQKENSDAGPGSKRKKHGS